MRSPQIIRSPKVWDVIVVGSGAGGGMAAKVLSEAGAEVLLLEAGREWSVEADSKMFAWPYDSPRRGAATPEHAFGEFHAGLGGWELEGEPYTVAEDQEFDWFRTRQLGGRTNHWGRISLRYGPRDFQPYTHDGRGFDWPITYEELEPYYDRLDRMVGIFGSREGRPNDPDGIFMEPPEPRCWELLVKRACDRMGIPCIPSRISILTEALGDRVPCHYCGQCGRGCGTHSNFSTPSVLLPPARATGRLTIRTNAMVREVLVDERGRAAGVSYIDTSGFALDDRAAASGSVEPVGGNGARRSAGRGAGGAPGREVTVRARIVVLAASACETARLLLNSTSTLFPDGLANSSGMVGRYLTDNTGTDVMGFVPALMDNIPHNEDGVGGGHLYMPWWLDNRELEFPRGYHVELWGGRSMPGYGIMSGIHRYPSGGGYGRQLKDDYRRYYGAVVGFSGRGEMIPNEKSYCEIDPDVTDRWGIPVLRFHFEWGEGELLQVRHMQETFRRIIEEMGGTSFGEVPDREEGYGILPGGRIIHELGVTRMGDDPRSSVLDRHCRAHDVPNLFVADGGPFVSNADKNPTWTILALAMRTAEHIVQERNNGSL